MIVNIILVIILWNLLISSISYKLKLKNNRLYCGMAGFSSNSNFDVDKIKTLIYINAIERGMDSTGFYSPLNGLKKSMISGDWLVTCASNKHPIIPDNFFMGHCRAATVGIKDIKNAHPFKRGNYILQHNGTLNNHFDLLNKYELEYNDYNVDSDIITGCIEKANNITTVLKEINGPAAIIIRDIRKPDLMYVFRNKDRPLFKGNIGSDMYISSIGESLVLIGCTKVTEFKEDTLYIIKNGEIKSSNILKNVPYKHKFSNKSKKETLNDYTTEFLKKRFIFKSLGCWLRSHGSWTISINGETFELKKDKYYFVEKILSNTSFKILDTENGKFYNCSIANLMVNEDTIYEGDWVKAQCDVYHAYDKSKLACKKGEVFKCRDSFNDGELTINEVGTNYYLASAKKIYFHKLTPEEVKKHEENIENAKNNLKPVIINSAEVSAKTFIEQLPLDLDQPINESENKDIILANDDNLLNEDDELSCFFQEMDDRLEDLLTLASNNKCPEIIINKIKDIIDINYIASDEFNIIEK